MSATEKLVVILGSLAGFMVVVYFLFIYSPDVTASVQNTFYDYQRIQGKSLFNQQPKRQASSSPYSKPDSKTNFVKWSGENNISYMDETLKSRKYKETKYTDNTKPRINTPNVNPSSSMPRYYPNNRHALTKPKTNAVKAQCEYYKKMKERVEERMRSGYSATEYNWLEGRRKHWAKKYSSHCFNGYHYPR